MSIYRRRTSYVVAAAGSGVSATGGTETTYSLGGINYKVHTFTVSGNFVVSTGGNVDVLVVGGGGGSGAHAYGGGGGGGGLIFRLEFSVSAGTIPVTVGAGGTGGVWPTLGNKGGNSVFSTLTALGGGGGGTASTGSYDQSGTSGGGGGGSSFRGDNRRLGKTATDASQGKNGGDGDG